MIGEIRVNVNNFNLSYDMYHQRFGCYDTGYKVICIVL